MKAIGIVKSPRNNGNVDILVQAVLDGARNLNEITTRVVRRELLQEP